MNKLDDMLLALRVKAECAWNRFMDSERGDTNFVSMLLIIGIVVVIAGLFLTFGRGVMTTISGKVTQFISKLN